MVDAGGRELRVSSADRVIFPAAEEHARDQQARGGRVLPGGGGRHHARAAQPADDARALAQGRARGHDHLHAGGPQGRGLLPEAGAQGSARLRGDGADRVPLRPPRRRGLPDRDRGGRLVRSDGHADLPPLAGAQRRRGPSRRAAARPRPPARHRLRGRPARGRGGPHAARRAGLPRLPQDLGRARHPHLRADRAEVDLHRRAPLGDRVRARARAPHAGRGDHQVVEGGARREGVHRLQPERPRPHDRLAVQHPREAGRARVRAAAVGRGARRGARGLHGRDDAGPLRRRGRPLRRDRRRGHSLQPLLDMYERDEEGDMPYPPDYPKMPGEPKRVQPSRDTDRKK